jgi:hypothetical protein
MSGNDPSKTLLLPTSRITVTRGGVRTGVAKRLSAGREIDVG